MSKVMDLARMLYRYRQSQIAVVANMAREHDDGLLIDGAALAWMAKALSSNFDDWTVEQNMPFYALAHNILDDLGVLGVWESEDEEE